MKTKTLFLITGFIYTLSSCAFNRIGDLTVVSTRNFDSSEKYVLLQKEVSAKAKSKRGDALDQAIDNVTASVNGGEFLKNVKIYIKPSGKKIKVTGDVWGTSSIENKMTVSVSDSVILKIGDRVSFGKGSKLKTGKIVGINQSKVVVECSRLLSKNGRIIELGYNDITKIAE